MAAPVGTPRSARVAQLGCGAVALAWVAGFSPIVVWLASTPAALDSGSGLWLMAAGLGALALNVLSAILAVVSLALRRADRAPHGAAGAIVALVLALLGLVGVALLLLGGLFMVAPAGPR